MSTSTTTANAPAVSKCICGSVTLTLLKPLETYETSLCFCNHCAKNSGSDYQVNLFIPKTEITVSDPDSLLKSFGFDEETVTTGKGKQKFFCGRCGVNMFVHVDVLPEVVVVKGGTLSRGELELFNLIPRNESV
ncbi:Mss4-like protein [Kalaharituber pfeilii]|nr:Mss4-like protein [Kalaharituber pfeilii]